MRQARTLISFIFFLFFSLAQMHAQLVNIESKRLLNDTVRFAGSSNINFAYQQINESSLSQFGAFTTYQIRSKKLKDIYLFLGSYDVSKSNKVSFNDALFFHLRYTHKFNSFVRWEVFSQLQNNAVMNLQSRALLGTGARFKILSKKNLKSSLGVLYMFEHEVLNGEASYTSSDYHRISSYFTFTFTFPKDLAEINLVTYYQPRIDLLNDFRFTNQTQINFPISKQTSFIFSLKYAYDAFPPEGIVKNSFVVDFGMKIGY